MPDNQTLQQPLKIGEQLAHYKIEKILGSGGFGITYLATDLNLERQVVIKEFFPKDQVMRSKGNEVLPLSSGNDNSLYQHSLKKFLTEGQTLAKFKHPNIAFVLSAFPDNNTAYIVMEYNTGETLAEFIKKRNKPLDWTQIKKLFLPICKGLQALHRKDLLHLDIKPDNIYLPDKGEPYLIDFGGVRQFIASKDSSVSFMIVTPGYAPAEQHSDTSKLGFYSDIYALGMTLYYALTLEKKFPQSTDRQQSLFEGDDDPLPLLADSIITKNYPKDFITLTEQSIQPNRNHRLKNIDNLISVLEGKKIKNNQIKTNNHSPKRQQQAKSTNPSPVKKIIIALVVLTLVSIGIWQFNLYQAEQEKITQADASRYQYAKTTHTIASYQGYIDGCELCADKQQAQVQIEIIKLQEPLAEQQKQDALAEQQRQEALAEQQKQEALAEQQKQDALAEQQKQDALAEQQKQDALAEQQKQDALAEQQKQDALAEQQKQDALAEQQKQDALAEQQKQDALAEQQKQDALAEQQKQDALAEQQKQEALAEQQKQDALAEQQKQDALAEQQKQDALAEQQKQDALAEQQKQDALAEQQKQDALAEQQKQDALAEQQKQDALAEQQKQDALAEQQKQDALAEQQKQDALAEQQKQDALAEQQKQDALAEQQRQEALAEQQRQDALAEQQRQDALAEQQRQDALAEQQRQDALAEQQRQDALAEQQRQDALAEQQRQDALAEQQRQDALAEQQRLEQRIKKLAGEFVLIPRGSFRMGGLYNNILRNLKNEKPVHTVTINKPFLMSKTEITQAQWQAVMGNNPSHFKGNNNRPVEQVSWIDIQTFIKKLKQITGNTYRLPSEAEWEYAARAGSTSKFHWGNQSPVCQRAVANGARFDDDNHCHQIGPASVASYQPNAWGLYDMSGNVWEWTADCWNDSYHGAPTDGSVWQSGDCKRRIIRGNSWRSRLMNNYNLRNARRARTGVRINFHDLGFRLIQDP